MPFATFTRPSGSALRGRRAMEAASLASLARKLEALDYCVPAEGLPSPAGPLVEQARASRGRSLRGARHVDVAAALLRGICAALCWR